MFVSALIVCMCVCSLPQKGDETQYKLTEGSACCRFAQLNLAQVPRSDVELPVKQETFKCWLESYGIACKKHTEGGQTQRSALQDFPCQAPTHQTLQVFSLWCFVSVVMCLKIICDILEKRLFASTLQCLLFLAKN